MPTSEEITLKVNIEFKPEHIRRAAEAVIRLKELLWRELGEVKSGVFVRHLQAINEFLASASPEVSVSSCDRETQGPSINVVAPTFRLDDAGLLRRPLDSTSPGVIDLNDGQLLDMLDREANAHNLRWLAINTGNPGIGTVSGAERHGIRDAIRALLVFMRQAPDHCSVEAGDVRSRPVSAEAQGLSDEAIRQIAVKYCVFETEGRFYNVLRYEIAEDFFNFCRALLTHANGAATVAEPSGDLPIELRDVAEAIAEGGGQWRTCTGCHESMDGHPVGEYPHSKVLGCTLGGGCSECGGIGAVWDTTDYAAMAYEGWAQVQREQSARQQAEPVGDDRAAFLNRMEVLDLKEFRELTGCESPAEYRIKLEALHGDPESLAAEYLQDQVFAQMRGMYKTMGEFDNKAVDRFATAMKRKMAASRKKGRSGWDDPKQCPPERLAQMLIDHLAKGDPVDVGNFAMMLFNRPDAAGALAHAAQSVQRAGVAKGKQVVVDRYMVCGIAAVERARQMRGPDMWKVERSGENLNKDGQWEHEPPPSSRGDAFLERCRFKSAEEAIAAALRVAPVQQPKVEGGRDA